MKRHEGKLVKKPVVYNNLTPTWIPCCHRLTLCWGWIEALTKGYVEFIPKERRAELPKNGWWGRRKVNGIVCATGFDTSHPPHYPMIGRNRISLADHCKEHPTAYMSLATVYFGPSLRHQCTQWRHLMSKSLRYLCVHCLVHRQVYPEVAAQNVAIHRNLPSRLVKLDRLLWCIFSWERPNGEVSIVVRKGGKGGRVVGL